MGWRGWRRYCPCRWAFPRGRALPASPRSRWVTAHTPDCRSHAGPRILGATKGRAFIFPPVKLGAPEPGVFGQRGPREGDWSLAGRLRLADPPAPPPETNGAQLVSKGWARGPATRQPAPGRRVGTWRPPSPGVARKEHRPPGQHWQFNRLYTGAQAWTVDRRLSWKEGSQIGAVFHSPATNN